MMNQEDIFKKIGQILSELNDQYQYLAQNPQELNELELELFLANASFLSDHVQIVRKLNTKPAPKILPEHTETAHDEVLDQQAVIFSGTDAEKAPDAHEEITAPEITAAKPVLEEDIFKIDNTPSPFEFILNEKPGSDKFEFEEKSIDEIFDRPLSKEEELIIAQKQRLREKDSLEAEVSEDDEIGPEPFLVSEPKAADLIEVTAIEETEVVPQEDPDAITSPAETAVQAPIDESPKAELVIPAQPFSMVTQQHIEESTPIVAETQPAKTDPVNKPTLNDILSGNTGARNLHTEKPRMAITDLKQAISLNDKMRYIKDLFNGYNLAYAEAIDLLNKMPDFKTAESFLQNNYAVKNNWISKQETADQFYELLHQRFPAK